MQLEKTKIYGVDNVGGSSPTLVRTDSSVGLSYTVEASEIKSDFDSCYPFCEMREEVDGLGNVFIRIPKFYSKITPNANGTHKLQISGCRYDGFSTLFIDGQGNELDYVLVGKYEGSCDSSDYNTAKMKSVSGATVKVSINITNYRKACMNNGDGYQQYDFLIDAIIKQLFMIEFATTHSQSIIYGWANGNSAALITGHTDNVKTASGSWNNNHDAETDAWTDVTCNTDGHHACKYRGIENPFGNVWKFVDGINFVGDKIYFCSDPTHYRTVDDDNTTFKKAPYTYVGKRCMSEGYLKTIAQFDKYPLLGYASAIGAGTNTYYSDYYYAQPTGVILIVGGAWHRGVSAGLWYWDGRYGAGDAYGSIGGRLCYKPL